MGMLQAQREHEDAIERVNTAHYLAIRKQTEKDFHAGRLDAEFLDYLDPSEAGAFLRIGGLSPLAKIPVNILKDETTADLFAALPNTVEWFIDSITEKRVELAA